MMEAEFKMGTVNGDLHLHIMSVVGAQLVLRSL